MESIGIELLALFVLLGGVAGCVDAIAGGGGLIMVPMLLASGLPPTAALATNKLGSVSGALAATVHFVRVGQLSLRSAWPLALLAFGGSVLGCWLLTRIDSAVLARLIPVLLIAFALYFAFSPQLGQVDSQRRLSPLSFAVLVPSLIGFYDGFFGPGTGAFLAMAFVLLAGFNLVKATAHAKLLNFSSNLGALLFFIGYGSIHWDIGLALTVGQLLGGTLGARLAIRGGQRLIRWVMVVMSLAISIKLLGA
ncbi:hypothetical protein LX59_02522 [Azomonas agilis]|uniref:Probable membrane transporter protein n=1 Tax=Azomonas agilis TaxID=116849 RepID=A0A562HZU5_9GAMM|nr:TSUP family transporter [Azomonas agilis]TWH64319.1 hypothetical protein LX59_02522 [Azomonas agilis]